MALGGVPEGAVCANHVDTPATATCKRCGTFVCNSCAVFDAEGTVLCAGCAPRAAGAIPWERRREIGFGKALVGTIKLAMLRPSELFRAQPSDLGYGSPLFFAVVTQAIGQLFAAVWQTILALVMIGMTGGGSEELFAQVLPQAAILVFSPLLTVLGVFIWSGIVHLCLTIFGGARGSFDTTLRVVAYGTATAVWGVIPLVGAFIGSIWSIVIEIIGLTEAHRTTGGRAAAAVLVPIALCCVVVLVFVGLAAFSISSALM
ncbi:MAG: YIP1 family protein [Deltaproteobacteria bacterium]|nr:YIP1 family protein [Deltaproteobacteria bacterium]